jgi:transcriptional antiterminator RfaH
MEQWYALHTKPYREYQVATLLRQRDIQVYLPEITSVLPPGGRSHTPFFPTYLFARLDLASTTSPSWEWTPGLRTIVRLGGQPAPVPDEVIAFIQQKLSEMRHNVAAPVFKPGEEVRVTAGPFRDMVAIFDGPSTPAMRVRVLLAIMNRATPVHLAAEHLEAVKRNDVVVPVRQGRRTRGRGRPIRGAPR